MFLPHNPLKNKKNFFTHRVPLTQGDTNTDTNE